MSRRTSRKIASRTSRQVAPNGGKRVSKRGGSDFRRIEDAAREAGWEVEHTRSGHMVFRSPDRSAPPIYLSGDIGAPRQIRNVEAMLRRHGLETHPSRMKRNVIPPPPSDDAEFLDWARRTFAPGTRVRLRWPAHGWDDDGNKVLVPAGTTGTVRKARVDDVIVDVTIAEPLFLSRRMIPVQIFLLWSQVVGDHGPFRYDTPEDERNFGQLEALDDHWGPQAVPILRPWKGRYTAPNRKRQR